MGAISKAWKLWTAGSDEILADSLNLMQPRMGAYADIPASPTAGMMYLATDTLKVYACFVNNTWVEVLPVVHSTGDETIGGIKTYTSIPVLPDSDPTTGNQAVRKAYADTKVDIAKCGVFNHDDSVTGTETIAHGLGKIPKLVKFSYTCSQMKIIGSGSFDGTNHVCNGLKIGTTVYVFYKTDRVLYSTDGAEDGFGENTYCYATVTVDATNITLTWSRTGTFTGHMRILWEVIG